MLSGMALANHVITILNFVDFIMQQIFEITPDGDE